MINKTRRYLLFSSLIASTMRRTGTAETKKQNLWMPKLSENLADVNPSTLRWLKQLGCKHVIFQGTDRVDSKNKGYWTLADILPAKRNCDEAGLMLESMMIPIDFYRKARFGQAGRDEEIERVCRTIKAVGESGVPMLEWRFWPDFYWDDRVGYYEVSGRGEAALRAYDYGRVKN